MERFQLLSAGMEDSMPFRGKLQVICKRV